MEKWVFKSKLIYWISIVFFTTATLLMFTAVIVETGGNFKILNFIYLLILSILSLITCVKLFEKEKYVIVLINTFILLLLPYVLYYSFSFYSTHFIYETENLIFSCLLILYLVLVNKNKANNKGIEEIEEIGKLK